MVSVAFLTSIGNWSVSQPAFLSTRNTNPHKQHTAFKKTDNNNNNSSNNNNNNNNSISRQEEEEDGGEDEDENEQV